MNRTVPEADFARRFCGSSTPRNQFALSVDVLGYSIETGANALERLASPRP